MNKKYQCTTIDQLIEDEKLEYIKEHEYVNKISLNAEINYTYHSNNEWGTNNDQTKNVIDNNGNPKKVHYIPAQKLNLSATDSLARGIDLELFNISNFHKISYSGNDLYKDKTFKNLLEENKNDKKSIHDYIINNHVILSLAGFSLLENNISMEPKFEVSDAVVNPNKPHKIQTHSIKLPKRENEVEAFSSIGSYGFNLQADINSIGYNKISEEYVLSSEKIEDLSEKTFQMLYCFINEPVKFEESHSLPMVSGVSGVVNLSFSDSDPIVVSTHNQNYKSQVKKVAKRKREDGNPNITIEFNDRIELFTIAHEISDLITPASISQ